MADSFMFADWFRGSAPYIDKHRDRTFVILVEGAALNGPQVDLLLQDFALLHTLGVRIVLVFGIRESMDAEMISMLPGQRSVVDDATMELITVEANRIRVEIESRFSIGLPNTPMHGLEINAVSGNLVMAKPVGIRDGIDFSHAGEVRGVRTKAIQHLLDQRMLVLVPPLGHSGTGELFALDASEVAGSIAVQLKADKLILLGEREGLTQTDGELIRQLSPKDAEQISLDLHAEPQLARHFEAACAAAQQGVARTHLLSWRDSNALLNELFTRDGVGTMISSERYEQMRPARLADVAGLLELMRPLEEKGILIHRSRERLEQQIGDYHVIVRDGMTIGCAALHRYDESRMGELACLVVHPDYRGGDRGELLLAEIEREARLRSYTTLFALTTHTSHWFMEHGFRQGKVEDLPEKRREGYNVARNSKVLLKDL